MQRPIVLSLCDFSGAWCAPYRAAGYRVVQIDLKHGGDVRTLAHVGRPVSGILCAPPCTAFAVSGAQYWRAKDRSGETLAGLAIVDACLRAVAIYRPRWWVLENPAGRLRRWLGPPVMTFNPNDFGDAYRKKTLLWGDFIPPRRDPVAAVRSCAQGSWVQTLGGRGGELTRERRSVTPAGFARAFFEANP